MSVIKTYDSDKYDFVGEVARIFDVPPEDLHKIHHLRKDLMPESELNFSNETKTHFHSVFYGALNSVDGAPIKEVYYRFIESIIEPIFRRPFLYQSFPSFRVHIPNDQAVHKWHYDSDEDHRHPEWEINFQIALTKMWGSNAMWLESIPDLGDFKPIEMEVGEFCIFNGNKCMHGNKLNKTRQTRVSMDFRVLPYEKYNESECLESVTANRKFVKGDYYKLYEKKGDTYGLH